MPEFACTVCGTLLTSDGLGASGLVRCPSCGGTVRVPTRAVAVAEAENKSRRPTTLTPPPPSRGAGRKYGFNCVYCSSRLNATDSMAGQAGACPTCGNNIIVPIRDRYGRLIDPLTNKVIKQDPHPVHAYAANGTRAPGIVRVGREKQVIQCASCASRSPMNANNCKACGTPFTMEGTTHESSGSANLYSTASLVLGLVGLITPCFPVFAGLAVIFGMVGIQRSDTAGGTGGRGMAISGLVLGLVGGLISVGYYFK